MENCAICSSELKFMNTPTFGSGKLSDGGVVCTSCFRKINNINPKIASNLKKETTGSIIDFLKETPEEKKSEGKKSAIGCLVLIAIIALIVWIFYPTGEKSEQFDAYFYAQVVLKENLKAPSTAKFPVQRDATITKLEDGRYEVKSYVDAQNSFGAMIRSDFMAIMRKKGDNWYCDYLEMEGKRYK